MKNILKRQYRMMIQIGGLGDESPGATFYALLYFVMLLRNKSLFLSVRATRHNYN